jgi:hypothetical protein
VRLAWRGQRVGRAGLRHADRAVAVSIRSAARDAVSEARGSRASTRGSARVSFGALGP